MRLRPLTEAECYARCYGGRRGEGASFVRLLDADERLAPLAGEQLGELFDGTALAPERGHGLEAA